MVVNKADLRTELIMTNLHILMSWTLPHMPRKKLTANRAQFLGMITKQYLDQINPGKKPEGEYFLDCQIRNTAQTFSKVHFKVTMRL